LLLLVGAATLACGEVQSSPGAASHRPGDPCLSCHGESGIAEPPLSVGGTVYASSTSAKESKGLANVALTITDARGVTAELVTDDAGNFYTDEPLEAPLLATVESGSGPIEMPVHAPSANCNTCHRNPGANARALGWIRPARETGIDMRPGEDCLRCHAPPVVGDFDPAPHFGAAGTVGGEGATVRIVDATGRAVELATSASGNFYTAEALVPPLSASVTRAGVTRTKVVAVDSGACNGCHDGAESAKLSAP